jgi:hypothetical protein
MHGMSLPGCGLDFSITKDVCSTHVLACQHKGMEMGAIGGSVLSDLARLERCVLKALAAEGGEAEFRPVKARCEELMNTMVGDPALRSALDRLASVGMVQVNGTIRLTGRGTLAIHP